MQQYDHSKIEKKWQKSWAKAKLYQAPDSAPGKDNFFLLIEFPYPSGNLHVGHWYAFAVPDILARHLRMKGKNVLYPIGFDAFGLPAENAAIKNKINPREWTEQNMAHMRDQIASMGTSFDVSREVVTCHPDYYKWTQWLFLRLFEAGLAYRKETAVNWCPKDKTVLANEQVVAGKCERCGAEVEQRQMLQWNLKITDYADRLVDDLDALDWPEEIKDSQRNWIGRSEGAEIDFPLDLGKKYKYVILHGFQGSPEMLRWKWVKAELEKMGHEVIIPALPDTDDPSEESQVAAALAATTYDENTVLCGHSLGSVVALKVLEKLDKPIARLVTIGGFASPEFKDKKRNFISTFSWKFDYEKIRRNAPSVTILHDVNDYGVSETQVSTLEDLLGVRAVRTAAAKPHFTGDKEPDVLLWLLPTIRIFTTRPDTLFGATYLVLAPEHPWLAQALGRHDIFDNREAIVRYIALSNKKTELERQANTKEKTGVRLEGVEAINPASGEKIPLYVADYVLAHYGTGAIMAVPAHDERDFAFAKRFDLPIREVIEPVVVRTSGIDTFRSDIPSIDRPAVMAVIKHWSEEKFLCLRYKSSGAQGFVGGGIEEGESPEESVIREIREETGYTDVEVVRRIGAIIHSQFYGVVRQKNIAGHFVPLVCTLRSGARVPISEEEQALQEVQWVDAAEVGAFINREDFKILWNRVQDDKPYTGKGILFNSGEFSRLTNEEAIPKMGDHFGRKKKTYRLRDWIVSRQRYWGVPIPIVHCSSCGSVPVPREELPILLPDVEDYLPTGDGKSPLAKVTSFVHTTCPKCAGKAERETDTFDTFVDSSWYFLRYTDPKNVSSFADHAKQDAWMPVDLYSGGAEHTTMHLLYSRFWQKTLFDLGLVADAEPYSRRMNRSIILGPDGQKMSKSRGNVIDPDEVVKKLGADTVRMYLAFIGPYNEVGTYPWNPDGVIGVRRFIERVWKATDYVGNERVAELESVLHRTIKKVGEDSEVLKFNTAIAQLMILLNEIEKYKKIGADQWATFLRLLAPFAPHMSEELWHEAGNATSVHLESWPVYDEATLRQESVKMAVQIDGKTRGEIEVPIDTDKAEIERLARGAAEARLSGNTVARTVLVSGRLVNFVLKK